MDDRHLVHLSAAILLALGFGVWALKNYLTPEGTKNDLAYAIGGFVAAVALVVYECYFLKKLKNVTYL